MSFFSNVQEQPEVEFYAVMKLHANDQFPQKALLGVGIYRTDEEKPWVLPVVRIAEKELANDDTLNKDYIPTLGIEQFTSAATKLLLGEDSKALAENRVFGVQGLSCTGSLRVGAEFLAKVLNKSVFYYSDPTWGNHRFVFLKAGFKEARTYRYWDSVNRTLDIEGLLEDLNNAPKDSIIVLHAVAHNPTGCDPTKEQWMQIAKIMKERKLFPFFDCAYQGFASGDLDKDAWAVRYFVSQNFEMFCAQSFSKNLGLYDERIGNLTVVVNNPNDIVAIKSEFTLRIRSMYQSPPSHGARIVTYILTRKELFDQWCEEIKIMSSRIFEMRKRLREEIERLETPGAWDHITTQIGMFCYTGLNAKQVEHMRLKHHVYMLSSGRISITGLNSRNVEYVANCINETVRSLPS